MDIWRYLEILQRRKWVVLVTTLAVVAVVAIGMRLMAPVYSASSMVRITEERTGPVSFSDTTYSQLLQNTYVQLLQSRPSMEAVIQQLGLKEKPEILAGAIKVEAVPTTELIRVTASNSNPKEAADIANAIASLAVKQPPASYTVSVVSPAAVPENPTRPQPTLYLALATLAGLVGGLGLAFLFEGKDRAVHSAEDLDGMVAAPLLGGIPSFRVRRKDRVQAILLNGTLGDSAGEAFRILSANVLARALDWADLGSAQTTTLLVSSPEAKTGKSTVLANLATTMAREGHSVIVVGTNLLHPDLPRVFGILDKAQVPQILRDPRHAESALVTTGIPGVKLLPATALSATLDLPPSLWMRDLIETLAHIADVVLLDSPAILASADAAMIAPLVDGVILVAAREHTTDRNLNLARAQIEAVGGRVLGLVFNRAKLPGKGNLYAGPVGGWAVPHGGRLQKVKDPIFPVTTRETKNGSSSNKKAVSGDHGDRLEKAN